MAKQKPVIIRTPVPTVEEMRIRLGMSKRRAEQIKKIMLSPVKKGYAVVEGVGYLSLASQARIRRFNSGLPRQSLWGHWGVGSPARFSNLCTRVRFPLALPSCSGRVRRKPLSESERVAGYYRVSVMFVGVVVESPAPLLTRHHGPAHWRLTTTIRMRTATHC
jgi:hypothetical protein